MNQFVGFLLCGAVLGQYFVEGVIEYAIYQARWVIGRICFESIHFAERIRYHALDFDVGTSRLSL